MMINNSGCFYQFDSSVLLDDMEELKRTPIFCLKIDTSLLKTHLVLLQSRTLLPKCKWLFLNCKQIIKLPGYKFIGHGLYLNQDYRRIQDQRFIKSYTPKVEITPNTWTTPGECSGDLNPNLTRKTAWSLGYKAGKELLASLKRG
jgi:hypothetical protein